MTAHRLMFAVNDVLFSVNPLNVPVSYDRYVLEAFMISDRIVGMMRDKGLTEKDVSVIVHQVFCDIHFLIFNSYIDDPDLCVVSKAIFWLIANDGKWLLKTDILEGNLKHVWWYSGK